MGKELYNRNLIKKIIKKDDYYIVDYINNDYYIGYIKNNLKHGKGILNKYKKYVYQGEFLNNKKNGKGDITYSNGCKWCGIWKNDKKNGFGMYTNHVNNEMITIFGIWKDDILQDDEVDLTI